MYTRCVYIDITTRNTLWPEIRRQIIQAATCQCLGTKSCPVNRILNDKTHRKPFLMSTVTPTHINYVWLLRNFRHSLRKFVIYRYKETTEIWIVYSYSMTYKQQIKIFKTFTVLSFHLFWNSIFSPVLSPFNFSLCILFLSTLVLPLTLPLLIIKWLSAQHSS